MITSQNDAGVDQDFPDAAADGYALTSARDTGYNCIAWAAGETKLTWWPTPFPIPGNYWPSGIPPHETLEAFMQAYGTIRYQDCQQDGSLEAGYEKIALYVDASGKPTHAARQLQDGTWTSKLGKYKDIQHTTPAALESRPQRATRYGSVARYMKRQIVPAPTNAESLPPAPASTSPNEPGKS